jgi:hypothetical protein
MTAILARLRRLPLIELLLIVGLPLAVMIAGARMTVTAMNQGFTPIEQTTVAPKGH